MNLRFTLMALMLFIGILIAALVTGLEMPSKWNADMVSSVETAGPAYGALAAAKDEPASGGSHPLGNEKAKISIADPTVDPDRIALLKELVDQEISERRRLEKQVAELWSQVRQLEQIVVKNTRLSSEERTNIDRQREASSEPGKASEARFLAAGFDAEQAARLRAHMGEIEMERLYLRDRASREGWIRTPEYFEAVGQLRQGIREQLGEDAYDRFLFAMDRPNRLIVESVIESSPAQQIGLQPGDTIFRYDGRRIFSYGELRSATTGGDFGESVPVEIQRNGELLEYYIQRGPLGVTLDRSSVQP